MMIRISRFILWATVVALGTWLLPWAAGFTAGPTERPPFTLYSSVTGGFAWLEGNGKKIAGRDGTGRRFSEREFDSILPFFYYRQLVADNRFPDSVAGRAVAPRDAQTGTFMFRSSPRQINTVKPAIYPLLESMSGRVDLESPGDVFRFSDTGMEFVDCATNKVKREKSEVFTGMLRRKGFTFPATLVAGNPTVRKEYDEGFFIADAKGGLFHLKQTKGRPFVRRVELPKGVTPERFFVTEYRGRQFFGFMVDTGGQLYVLTAPDYAIRRVEVPRLDLGRQGLMIVGNPLDWTVKVSDPDGAEHLYAISASDFSLLKELHYSAPTVNWVARIPGLALTSPLDTRVCPRIVH